MGERGRVSRLAASEARGSVGSVAMGARRNVSEIARGLVEVAKSRVESEIAGDEAFIAEFCAMLKEGASREVRDRTCINAVLMILKLVGAERVVVLEWVKALGASSEGELQRAMEVKRSIGGVEDSVVIERLTSALEALLPLHPEHRGTVVRRLGGYLPTEVRGESV